MDVERCGLAVSAVAGWQLNPVVALNPDLDELLAVWEDERNGVDLDIYGQRLSRDGRLLGSNFAIVIGEHDQWAPCLLYNPVAQGYLLLWHHRQRNNYAIYAQRLSSAGTPQGTPVRIPSPRAGEQWTPGVAYDHQRNQALVVWEDLSDSAILGQLVSGNCEVVGKTTVISTRPKSQWTPPVVAFDARQAQYLVAWDELAPGDIYGQVVAADGACRGENLTITTAPGRQLVSNIVCNGEHGEYFVLWTDQRDLATHGSDIYGQRISSDGALRGSELVVSAAPESQEDCVGTYDPWLDETLLIWSDGRGVDTGLGIYGQRLSASGRLLGPNLPICAGPTDKVYPFLARLDTTDSYAVVWQDWHDGDNDETDADVYGLLYRPQRYAFWFPQYFEGGAAPGPSGRPPAP